jgi:hypothetical protein
VALKAIWASRALPKLKVFLWTLMIDRLNTRDIKLRKNWNIESGPECSICNASVLETRYHLFLECDFAISWNTSADFTSNFISTQSSFHGPCFLETMACACWNIWKVQNELIFL